MPRPTHNAKGVALSGDAEYDADLAATARQQAETVLTRLAEEARDTRHTCLAFVTRRWSGGIEADPPLSLDELWRIYDEHETDIWEAADSEDHEAWDEDFAMARGLDRAASIIRETFGLPEPETTERG